MLKLKLYRGCIGQINCNNAFCKITFFYCRKQLHCRDGAETMVLFGYHGIMYKADIRHAAEQDKLTAAFRADCKHKPFGVNKRICSVCCGYGRRSIVIGNIDTDFIRKNPAHAGADQIRNA